MVILSKKQWSPAPPFPRIDFGEKLSYPPHPHIFNHVQYLSIVIWNNCLLLQVSWTPYSVVCFIKMAGLPVTPTMSAIPLLFAKSSICWNPIIYVILNDQVNHNNWFESWIMEKIGRWSIIFFMSSEFSFLNLLLLHLKRQVTRLTCKVILALSPKFV